MGKSFNTGLLTNGIAQDSSNNVGIGGAANASYKLAVTGASLFSSNILANGVMSLGDDGTYGATYKTLGLTGNTDGTHRILAGTSDDMYIAAATSRGIKFCVNGSITTRAIITSTGNVGIGTSSPDNLLDVYGTGTNTTRIRVRGTTNFALFQAQNDSSSALYMGIDSSTASGFNVGNYSRIIWSGGAYPLVIATNDAERMRITSGGYTKMSNTGTYVSSTGNYHELRSSQTDEWTTFIQNTAASPYGVTIRYSSASPNGGGNEILYTADSTGQRATIRSNGGIANYQSNNVNLSDIRTKKDIIPLESYWDKFKAIEIVKFKYKDQTHDDFNIGVIAQQVEQIAPEFVDIDGWDSKLDEKNEEPLKSIYTEDLHHATIKVLQEAMDKIEELSAKVTALENK